MKKIKLYNEDFVDKDFAIKLKKRKIAIVIEGEEIYIEKFTFPKVKDHNIYDLVKNELICKFGSINNIIFDYKLVSKGENSITTIVYCINIENFNFLQQENYCDAIITKIDILQNYFKEYLSSFIKEKEYYLAFRYKRTLYYLAVQNDNIVANKVVNIEKNQVQYSEELIKFINGIEGELYNANKIYTIDLTLTNAELKNFIVVKLKDLNIKTFLQYMILKG